MLKIPEEVEDIFDRPASIRGLAPLYIPDLLAGGRAGG
jgi:hypothetical protein